MAASAVILVVYLDRFIPGRGQPTPLFVIPIPLSRSRSPFRPQTIAAIAAIVAAALMHIRGVGPGRLVEQRAHDLKIAAFVVFIAFGVDVGRRHASEPAPQSAGTVTATGWLFALIPVMFTYSGWNAAAYMAEEIRDPGRNVPRALALGTAAVIVIYLLLNVLYLYVMPIGELATVKGSVLDVVADRLSARAPADIMAVVSIVSLAAGINAWTFAGPRVYFAMARDGVFFERGARCTRSTGRRRRPIVAQAALAILLILTGSLDCARQLRGLRDHVVSGSAVAAVFVLRAREPTRRGRSRRSAIR